MSGPLNSVNCDTDRSLEYLIQDPHHEYAARLIKYLYQSRGHRAVCFYTDRRERLAYQHNYPVLRSDCIAASYDVSVRDLSKFASQVAATHNIAAVVPFDDRTLATAVELAGLLGLRWAQPDIMRRLQDSFALQEHIRNNYPQVHMVASRRVAGLADVLETRREPIYRRFVLKPNNRVDHHALGLFDVTADAATLESFCAEMPGVPLVLEQHFEGPEYFVNGQVDDRGDVCVVAIFESVRWPASGPYNVSAETLLLPRRDPRFTVLAAYARQVVQATGLRRSPFHLQLKSSDSGPYLTEIAARFAAHGNTFLCEQLHGPGLDLFALAAHHYFSCDNFGPVQLNWESYDSHAIRYVHGISARRERIITVDGIPEVESLDEFHRWVKRPSVGDLIEPTRDWLTMPYSLILKGTTQDQLAIATKAVREILKINDSVGPLRRALVSAAGQARAAAAGASERLVALATVRLF